VVKIIRMSRQAKVVELTDREKSLLEGSSSQSKQQQRLVKRIGIILLAFAGKQTKEISLQLGISEDMVSHWRARWASNYEKLGAFQVGMDGEGVSDLALRREMLKILSDAPRPGSPRRISLAEREQIIALACDKPETHGVAITHWTHEELARVAVEKGIVGSISGRQVGRILKKKEVAPHKSGYWLYPKIEDFGAFQAVVTALCGVYLAANTLLKDVNIVCTDEKTGMQALEPLQAQEMEPGREEKRDPEYTRHGTLCLIAARSVSSGEIIQYTLGETRTEADFLKHIQLVIATDPGGRWIIVCDQLNTHMSATLVEWVAQQVGHQADLGVKGKQGTLKSMPSRKAFLEDHGHRIRFVYTPKHCSWLNQIENWFGLLQRKVLKRGNFKSKEELKRKVEAFILYYNNYLAKPYKWKSDGTKAVKVARKLSAKLAA